MSKIRLIFGGILFIILAALLLILSNGVSAAPGSAPLLDDPTPTPTPVIDYWTGSSKTFSWLASEGLDQCLETGWYLMNADGGGDCPDLTAPEENAPAGILLTLNSVSYSGDAGLQSGTNTNFAEKFNDYWTGGANEMTPGETICIGSSAGCSSQGYSVNSNSDWEGYSITGSYKYIPDLHVYGQLGGTSGGANYSIRPIFYGEVAECTNGDPDDRVALQTGLLIGTDEVGEIFDLVEGQDYELYTSDGPWNDGSDNRYDAAVRIFDGSTWGEWAELSSMEGDYICDDSFLDANGAAWVFTAEADQVQLQLRVNDTDDNFGDNSGDLAYYWLGGEGTGQGCGNNWSMDNLVGSVVVDSTDSSFQQLRAPSGDLAPMTAGMYALKLVGSYTDNGVTDNDVIIADWPENSGNHNNWLDENFFLGTQTCTDENANYTAYYGSARDDFYAPSKTYNWEMAFPLAKINNKDLVYGDNVGTETVELYTASYTAPPSDCSLKYDRGTWLDSVVVFSKNDDGLRVPQQINGLVPGQVYYVEPAGSGYSQNGTQSWDFQIGVNVNEGTPNTAVNISWYDPEVYADCGSALDDNRTGFYFIAGNEHIYLRAIPDPLATYADNEGSLGFNLYGAVPYEVPAGEDCGDYLSLDTIIWRGKVAADSTSGQAIDYSVFEAGQEYAVKIVSPGYTDYDGSGKTGEIRRAAPDVGAVSYESFEDWDGGICYEQVDGYDHVYFIAGDVSDYEIRATDPYGGGIENEGNISYEVWGTVRDREPVMGCELRDYSDNEVWYVVKERGIVNANNDGSADPMVLANEFSQEGLNYKIEIGYIGGVPDPNSESYILEISSDGGASWVSLENWVDCWVDLEDPMARGYFTTPKSGGPYLLRVHDAGGDWYDNLGGLQVKLWVDDQLADPGDVGSFQDKLTVAAWGEGCTAVCVAPGWLEIGQWVEYARCRLTRWLAWCPWHAEAIAAMGARFNELEPFRTIIELIGLGRAIKDEVTAYSWTAEGGGGVPQIEGPENFIFMPAEGGGADIPIVGDDSIWGSGEITLDPDTGYSFSTECNSLLADSLGSRLAAPVCFTTNILNTLGLMSWFQFFWDMGMVFMLLYYVKNAWVDKVQ